MWAGRPAAWRLFTASDIIAVPFSLLWLGMVLFIMLPHAWPIHNTGKPEEFIPTIFCTLFFLVGLYMTVGRFVAEFIRRQSTYYAVTNLRVLVLSGFFSRWVQGLACKTIPTITQQINDLGRGSLWFGNLHKEGGFFQLFGRDTSDSMSGSGSDDLLGFQDIPDARRVYQLIESTRQSSTALVSAPTIAMSPVPVVPLLRTDDRMIVERIEPYLAEQEQLLWAGQPDSLALFTANDWFAIPFAIVWCSLPTAGLIGMLMRGEGVYFLFFPFLIFGYYMLLGRFLLKYWRRRRTYYAVTNRHVILLTTLFSSKSVHLPLSSLPPVEEMIFDDGYGILRFGPLPKGAGVYDDTGLEFFAKQRTGWFAQKDTVFPPTFYHISHAQQVIELIRQLQERTVHG